jgi:hypothetical protein
VQQLPLEAMAQVGMYKQQKYDEGVQKIQSQIDNVAGLDIIRGVDKKYLQSKLDQLGNNLKSVAAADFSNFQLVNSVGGMANQIVKDKNVINAVSSTKAYRKGLEDMYTLNKEGKGSASNDWDFYDRAGKWLNGSLETGFSGTYSPYTNWKKNAIDVMKGLTKSEYIKDDAFDIKYDKSGKPTLVLQDAILREKLAGIPPESIQKALLVGLTPNDFKQLEIDGRYSYSNIDGPTLKNNVKASYDDQLSHFMSQRTVLDFQRGIIFEGLLVSDVKFVTVFTYEE